MKNAFLFLFCLSLISACEKNDGPSYPAPYQYFSPHTIADYLDGDLTLETIKKNEPDWPSTTCNDEGLRLVFRNTVLYQDPNLEEPVNTEQYLECALKNGDTKSYNMILPYNYPSTKHAFAFNCRSITVTSNKRFDANHPAGTPLNDLLILCVTTYGPHILSGYDPEVEEFQNVCKMLSEVTQEELSIVSGDRVELADALLQQISRRSAETQDHRPHRSRLRRTRSYCNGGVRSDQGEFDNPF